MFKGKDRQTQKALSHNPKPEMILSMTVMPFPSITLPNTIDTLTGIAITIKNKVESNFHHINSKQLLLRKEEEEMKKKKNPEHLNFRTR